MKKKIHCGNPLINNKRTEEIEDRRDGRILLPISKIEDDYHRTMYYVLFNTITHKFTKIKPKDIKDLKEAGYDIRGFGANNRPNQYFNKIKNMGTDDGYKRWLIWKISLSAEKPFFMLVDEKGIIKSVSKDELMEMAYKKDIIIIGVIMDKEKRTIKISRDIERSISNEDFEKYSTSSKADKETTDLDDNMVFTNGIIVVSAKE